MTLQLPTYEDVVKLGQPVTDDDVRRASLNYRDWFMYDWRLEARDGYEDRLEKSMWLRANGHAGWGPKFEFAQIGVTGDMGRGKTTAVAYEAERYGQWGHAFFHPINPDTDRASWLIGRKIHPAQVFEFVEVIPEGSIFAIDESHTYFDPYLGASAGIRGWNIQSAGLRKAECRIYLPTAMMRDLHPTVRSMCSEVWSPLKVEIDDPRDPRKIPSPHSDPYKFIQLIHRWDNYPFRRQDIVYPTPRQQRDRWAGLGPPGGTLIRQGEMVRQAFLITDTFARVAGAQAQQFALKDQQVAARAERRGEGGGEAGEMRLPWEHSQVLDFVYDLSPDNETFNRDLVALRTGIRASEVSKILNALFGAMPGAHPKSRTSIWRTVAIQECIPSAFRLVEDQGGRTWYMKKEDDEWRIPT